MTMDDIQARRLRSKMVSVDVSTLDYNVDSVTLQNKREPQRFVISEGQQGDILGSTFPNLVRFLAGLFVKDYKVRLVDGAGVLMLVVLCLSWRC